jgi:hypothetical protein
MRTALFAGTSKSGKHKGAAGQPEAAAGRECRRRDKTTAFPPVLTSKEKEPAIGQDAVCTL